nr:GNAT family N-acetyltransferase [Micromonospora polyrhachis]
MEASEGRGRLTDDRVVVRRIRPADAARMRALRLEMLADSPLAFLETLADAAARPHDEFAARIANDSTARGSVRSIAEHDGRLVGHAAGFPAPDDPELAIIFGVYLTPRWRGRGLLAELIEDVAAWSRSVGRPNLMLEVVVGNDRAVRAYERLGFVDTGVRVPHPTLPTLTELQMRRTA